MYVCKCVCVSVRVCVCMHACMYVCMYVCMYAPIYPYIVNTFLEKIVAEHLGTSWSKSNALCMSVSVVYTSDI